MFDQLLSLVKEHAGSAVIDNPEVPNEHNDAVCETAANSIIAKLKDMAGSGGTESITKLFQAGNNVANASEVKGISSSVAGDLMKKFGFNSAIAGSIVSQLIPVVMSKLTSKTNDPDDNSFTMDGVLKTLTGGGGGGILNVIKGFFGSK